MSGQRTGTREWSERSVNCCAGCSNACLYCYARANVLRYRRLKRGSDWRVERPKTPEQIAADPAYRRRYDGVVMLPTTHDWTAGTAEACHDVLGRLLNAGNRVLLVTKPRLEMMPAITQIWRQRCHSERCPSNPAAGIGPETLCDRCRAPGAGYCEPPAISGSRPGLEVRCTITAVDDSVRRAWEPNASSIDERIDCLRYLRGEGVPTSVSIEPCLQPDRAEVLVEMGERLCTGEIWIGKLNQLDARIGWAWRPGEIDDAQRLRLSKAAAALKAQQTDEAVMAVVHRLRGHPQVRWKDSYREVIARREPRLLEIR